MVHHSGSGSSCVPHLCGRLRRRHCSFTFSARPPLLLLYPPLRLFSHLVLAADGEEPLAWAYIEELVTQKNRMELTATITVEGAGFAEGNRNCHGSEGTAMRVSRGAMQCGEVQGEADDARW